MRRKINKFDLQVFHFWDTQPLNMFNEDKTCHGYQRYDQNLNVIIIIIQNLNKYRKVSEVKELKFEKN